MATDWYEVLLRVVSALYVGSAIAVVAARLGYDRRQSVVRLITAHADAMHARGSPQTLAGISRHALYRCLYDMAGPDAALRACANALVARVGESRLQQQADRARPRWRRVAAVRALVFSGREAAWPLLSRGITDVDASFRSAVIATLGRLPDRRSAALLVDALIDGQHGRSTIAAILNTWPADIFDVLVPLFTATALPRYWAAVLAARYAARPDVEERLRLMADDPDPSVRKAAIVSLGTAQCTGSVDVMLRLFNDPVPFVRAHAVRAVGAVGRSDLSGEVASMLSDTDWSTREAAKRVLESFGAAAEAAALHTISSRDAFARNSAAEILQNLGTFERLLMQEAAGPTDPRRVTQIRQLAFAGGDEMWRAVLANLPASIRSKVSSIVSNMDAPLESAG